MQRKIGEIFEHNGEWYQCVEGICNKECYFYNRSLHKTIADINGDGFGACNAAFRSDDKSVIFKKLKKVGEPYTHYCPSGRIIYFQRYKLFYKLYSHNTEYIMCDFNEDGIVSIETKQNKEDMREKKSITTKFKEYISSVSREQLEKDLELLKKFNESGVSVDEFIKSQETTQMKPFDLEAAKAGKPVCTRDGRKARIVCFDRVDAKPILALVASTDGKGEDVFDYFVSGKRIASALESDLDLVMPPEKKEGWVNISNCPDNGYSNYDSGVIVFKTKEEAINFTNNKDYIDTVKVTWEE